MKKRYSALSIMLLALGACTQEELRLPSTKPKPLEKMQSLEQQVQELSNRLDCITSCTVHNTCAGKIAPHYETNSLFVTGEFLYWKASESDLQFATHHVQNEITPFSDVTLNSGTNFSDTLESLHFKWNPGFRVGIGVELDHDNWDIYLNYTHIRNTAHRDITIPSITIPPVPTEYLVPLNGIATAILFTNHASAKWHVDYNVVDLELGKDFFVGTALSLRPHVGLRYASIHQKMHSVYDFFVMPGIRPTHLNDKFNFNGGGIEGGSDMFWHFNRHFGIYAELSGALLYGKFHITQKTESNVFVDPSILVSNSTEANLWQIKGALAGAIGLEWEVIFNCDKNRFALSAGYEITEWFQQNQRISRTFIQIPTGDPEGHFLIDNVSTFANTDLGFQGLTARATLDF